MRFCGTSAVIMDVFKRSQDGGVNSADPRLDYQW